MELHSKRLGTLGEVKVISQLVELGYSVFIEMGDISRIDLIAEDRGVLTSIQVKTITKCNGAYQFKLVKSGPNYKFMYQPGDCDVFAVYCRDDDKIVWINFEDLKGKTGLTFRIDPTKNNQSDSVHRLDEYLDPKRVLRGHEQSTLPDSAEGGDMVQTTTGQTPGQRELK